MDTQKPNISDEALEIDWKPDAENNDDLIIEEKLDPQVEEITGDLNNEFPLSGGETKPVNPNI
jgi:hypothetical protein